MGRDKLNKNYIMKKVNLLEFLIGLFVLVILTYSYFLINNNENKNDKANLLRVATFHQTEIIKEMYEKKTFKMEDDFYDYCVIDLKGSVIYSSIDDYKESDIVDVQSEIGYDNAFSKMEKKKVRYSIPLVTNNNQRGTIVFDLPIDIIINKDNKGFVILSLIGFSIIIILIYLNNFIKKDVIYPIKQLHRSAKNILRGSLEEKVIYDYDGEIGYFCHDFEAMREELKITKEREEKLKRNEKELLACISHDLKTPLSSISGYVEGIRDGVVKDKDGIRKYSDIILRKSKELSKLIDDILEQLKTDLNEMSVEKVEIYSDDYLLYLLDELSMDLAHYNIDLIVKGQIPKALIYIDPIRINQVINNIVTNSIKYSKPNSSIEFCVDDDIDRIIVNIKDYGSGISVDDIPFVFDKFYRGEKHRNTNIPGSGLGLSISKYIIERHGGKISCTSSLNKGTKMSFTINKL